MLNFKLKRTNEVQISIKDFVMPNGKVKMDPMSNTRLSFGMEKEIDIYEPTDLIMTKTTDLTIKNNSDAWLIDAIKEDGFDDQKQRITVMDLVYYCYGDENRRNIRHIYNDDKEFILVLNRITDIIEDYNISNAKRDELLKQYFGEYYVVVGGNTRVSILYQWYKTNSEAFNDAIRDDVKLPVSIIDYSYYHIGDRNYARKYIGSAGKQEIEKISKIYQILYYLIVYADNANSGRNNNGTKNNFNTRGLIARMMVENYSLGDSNLKPDASAKLKIESFKNASRCAGLGITEMIQGLIRVEILEELQNHPLDKDKDLLESLEFYIKLLTTYMFGANSSSKKDILKLKSQHCGVDYKTLKIVDHDRFIKLWKVVRTYHENNKVAASYLTNILNDVFYRMIKNKESLLSTDVNRINKDVIMIISKKTDHKDALKLVKDLIKQCRTNNDKQVIVDLNTLKMLEGMVKANDEK